MQSTWLHRRAHRLAISPAISPTYPLIRCGVSPELRFRGGCATCRTGHGYAVAPAGSRMAREFKHACRKHTKSFGFTQISQKLERQDSSAIPRPTLPTLPAKSPGLLSSCGIRPSGACSDAHFVRSAQVPTLAQTTLWVAKIGGYAGKSSDGPPGSVTRQAHEKESPGNARRV
jgi:hypothetical protein